MRIVLTISGWVALACLIAGPVAGQQPPGGDPYLWLEQLEGARALKWVQSENVRTLAVLQADSRFSGFYADALKIGEAQDRLPTPTVIGGEVYNFWQDQHHVRGVWRRTSLEDYAARMPTWSTVLDLDTLARVEGKNWVWQGVDCDSPSRQRCLISLSEGGEDASTIREFDLRSEQFVQDGFRLPRGKQGAVWAGEDRLLVAREWRPGQATTSGYPFVVKALARGRPLSSATELYRGAVSDVGVWPFAFTDGLGHRALGVSRGVSFFESENYLDTPSGLRRLGLPLKATLQGLIHNRLWIRLAEDWTAAGTRFASGSLISLDLAQATADPGRLQATAIYVPGSRETYDRALATRDALVVTTYDNVRGRAFIYSPDADGGWSRRNLDLPDNSSLNLLSADDHGTDAFVEVTGFLSPNALVRVDANAATSSVIKTTESKFDAGTHAVEQLEATSKDGTKIPYFVVRPKAMRYDGTTPTVLYGYGGFEIALTPSYEPTLGKLWLDHGGAFVVANIRGGGEFGPPWHEAGLKTRRQRIYDDFAAVAEDLIARKITSPRHLGIQGGSNGGLLMGVEFTQHPELWNAVDMQVPLLDMLRFERIQAGASWVGEYGSARIPSERAFLASISPYHNLKPTVRYPEPLIWTTTKDDRVGPQHARKFAAKLGAMRIPYLFYEVTEGGHGAGANIKERAFTSALEYTYFARKLMDAGPPTSVP
jgi:prolyl oligopeptidase